jgi:hypothetical protein
MVHIYLKLLLVCPGPGVGGSHKTLFPDLRSSGWYPEDVNADDPPLSDGEMDKYFRSSDGSAHFSGPSVGYTGDHIIKYIFSAIVYTNIMGNLFIV